MRADGAVPSFMCAAVIDAFGGPERLVLRDLPVPHVGPNDVLIRVDPAGIGPWDLKVRRGDVIEGRFPMVLGFEGSGTVAALGDGVRGFELGDAVYGYAYSTLGGFYAEYATLDAEQVAPLPAALDFREGGALPVAGLTALAGIDDVLAVRPGMSILVFGATGGTGVFAVQFAKRRGARVVATTNGGEGRELLRRLGADEVADTQRDDVVALAHKLAPHGLDGVFAFAGGSALERVFGALRAGATVAHPNGVAAFPATLPDGVTARGFDGRPNPTAFARLNALLDEAPIEIPISAEYSLDDAAEAHRRLERGHVFGKIVLVVDATEDVEEKVA